MKNTLQRRFDRRACRIWQLPERHDAGYGQLPRLVPIGRGSAERRGLRTRRRAGSERLNQPTADAGRLGLGPQPVGHTIFRRRNEFPSAVLALDRDLSGRACGGSARCDKKEVLTPCSRRNGAPSAPGRFERPPLLLTPRLRFPFFSFQPGETPAKKGRMGPFLCGEYSFFRYIALCLSPAVVRCIGVLAERGSGEAFDQIKSRSKRINSIREIQYAAKLAAKKKLFLTVNRMIALPSNPIL